MEKNCAVVNSTPASSSSQQPSPSSWTAYLIFCNATIVLGTGFAFGYNTSVVNGPFVVMNDWLNATFAREDKILTKDELSTQWSIAVSLYLVGGAVGSTWFPGHLSSSIGKRNALLIGSLIGAVAEAIIFISYYSKSYIPFMIGRAIAGFQGGLAIAIGPGLVNEHAPPLLRGACGTLFGIGISSGVELANLLGLPYILGTHDKWHFLYLVILGLYLFHGIGLFFVVESPRWLLDRKKYSEAIEAFKKLRNTNEDGIRNEYLIDKRISEEEAAEPPISVMTVLRNRQLWWPMFIVINLHIANVLTGLLAVLIYATLVINSTGLDAGLAAVANFGITFGTIVGNIICGTTVDRYGRRVLMLVGTLGSALVNVFLVIVIAFNSFQATIAGFAAFLIFFGMGAGPIAWFMPAEKFNHSARPMAMAVGTFSNWVGSIIVSFVFPIMQLKIGYYSFLPFAVIGFIEFVFFLLFLPETTHSMADYSNEIFAPGNTLLQLHWHLRYPRIHFPHPHQQQNEEAGTTDGDGKATSLSNPKPCQNS